MPRLNPAQPIVRDDKTMELPFWSFLIEVDKQIPIVGSGSPEGLVVAPYLSQYLDTAGGEGLVSYRKMLPDIAGDKSQGWVKLSVPSASFEVLQGSGDIGTGADQLAAGDHTHDASGTVSGTFADARISESSVTQHEAALSIDVSQITGLVDDWTYVSLSSDFSISTTANNNVTGLAFTPAANKNYHLEGMFLLETSTATTGAMPGIAWPTGYTNGAAMVTAPNTATAFATQFNVAGTTANAASTGLPIINKSYLGRMEGMLIMGGSPSGNLQVTLASEIAASSVTMKAGSFIRYREYT